MDGPWQWTLEQAGAVLIGTAHAQPAEGEAGVPGGLIEEVAHEEAVHGAYDYYFIAAALLIVIVIAWRPASRTILGMLDGRAARIRHELEEAAKLRDEAQVALATFHRRHRDAMTEAEDIIAQARGDAVALRAQAASDLKQALARREAGALDRIAQAEAAAVREVRTMAADTAIQAARLVLADRLPADRARELVDSAIAEIPRKLH